MSCQTFKEVSSSTIARWLKEVLHLAGIDTSIFKAHSYRSASTSAAFSCGISLNDVLNTANWTNANTFYRFYNRETRDSFSRTVVKGITFIFPAYMWIESFIYMEWLYTWSSDLYYSWNICEIW